MRTRFYISMVAVAIILSSCGGQSAESVIKDCESCLGENKTENELKNLSKKERAELASCLLKPLDAAHAKAKDMTVTEATEFAKQLEEAMVKSEYKDILKSMNYERLKAIQLAASFADVPTADLSTQYCEWAAKEAAAKASDDDAARDEADNYQHAIKSAMNDRTKADEAAFEEATKDCKDF